MKLLVTSFEPFGGETINPAREAAQRLAARVGGVEICRAELPVVFGEAGDKALAAMEALRPDAVLCVGQAGGRAALTVERVAINVDDARVPDNAGFCPQDAAIAPDGPAAYFATLPIRKMVEAMRSEGLAAEISNTAGTYVCNHLLYRLLHAAAGTDIRVGFIHVPFIPEQAHGDKPCMPLADIVRGLTAAIACLG